MLGESEPSPVPSLRLVTHIDTDGSNVPGLAIKPRIAAAKLNSSMGQGETSGALNRSDLPIYVEIASMTGPPD
jgi:hypothetical protein